MKSYLPGHPSTELSAESSRSSRYHASSNFSKPDLDLTFPTLNGVGEHGLVKPPVSYKAVKRPLHSFRVKFRFVRHDSKRRKPITTHVVNQPDKQVVAQFESNKEMISSKLHTWSETPAAIAGVTRND